MTKEKVERLPKIPRELEVMREIMPQLFEIVEQALTKPTKVENVHATTKTDGVINRLLVEKIEEEFSEDGIWSEESERKESSSGRTWIIDPLCGSYKVEQGNRTACTNIALIDTVSGFIFSLVINYREGVYYWASKENEGVWQGDTMISAVIQPGLKQVVVFDAGKLFLRGSHQDKQRWAEIARELWLKEFGLMAIGSSLAWAGAGLGLAGGLIVADTNPWDAAAAAHFVLKNGGIVTNFEGEPWKPGEPGCHTLVASLDHDLHAQLLEIIKANSPF